MREDPGEWRDGVHWHDHALAKLPGLTIDDLVDVLNDPNQLVIDPDPNSESGLNHRVVGFSIGRRKVMTLVLLRNDDGTLCCLTTFPANSRDRKLYQQVEDGNQQ